MRAVVFGAGNIGRGLVGSVLASSGYDLVFVDVDPGVIDMLKTSGSYRVTSEVESAVVPVADAILADDEQAVQRAVASSHLVATAVGGPILAVVAPTIGVGLRDRSVDTVNVLACENIHPNSTALRGDVAAAVGEPAIEGVGFPNVVVDRIVPGEPGARDITVETSFEFVVDATDWRGSAPETTPIVFTENLSAYKLRKLWLVNGLHVITAWLSLAAGYDYIHEGMADEGIRASVASAGRSAAHALAHRVDEFDEEGLSAYAERTLSRFANDGLPDLAARVARNPLAKLDREERVVGPALAAQHRGVDVHGFAAGIAAALTLQGVDVAGLPELDAAAKEGGWQALMSARGIDAGSPLFEAIRQELNRNDQKGETQVITEELTITNPSGLHARPAAEIVEKAKDLEAQVQIRKGDKVANAKSIMAVLALGANRGDLVTIEAEGSDAAVAVAAMREIMQAEEH